MLTAISSDAVAPGARIYRAYHLGRDGDFHSATVIGAATDDEARVAAATLISAFGVHLWERARFLGDFPPRAAPANGRLP